ncbi:MAG TPA: CHAD domain-containing protein [Blastocatellia bacterium]|nr:CHAD domain-containing protein [Blastocatellia bacterium]
MIEGETPDLVTMSPAIHTAGKPGQTSLFDIISDQIVLLQSYHRAVMETAEVEAIHKMRVSTRRLQASVDLLLSNHRHSQKDKTERYVRRLKKQLRKWRRRLSRVRNYDVFLIMLEKEISARRGAHREQYELMKAILNEHREAQVGKIRRNLEHINIEGIANRLGIDITPPQDENGGSEQQEADPPEQVLDQAALEARSVLTNEKKIALRAAQRLEQRVEEFYALAEQVHPTIHPEEMHQLRIAAKRVRYLLEILKTMGVGNPDRSLTWLRTLQGRIGDWHDLEALEEEIISILSQPGFMKEHLAESSRLLIAASQLQKKKLKLVSRLFPITVPKHIEVTSQRLTRALRRRAAQEQFPAQTVSG